MGMEVNGQNVLTRIAETPSAFGLGAAQVNALATATLLGRLKDKATTLTVIRSIVGAIGTDDFAVALDHLSDKGSASLAKKLDPKNPSIKSADASSHRKQIIDLAQGKAEPMSATPKTPKAAAPTARSRKPKTGDVMESKALKARAPRKTNTGG